MNTSFKDARQALFDHMASTHNLHLLESEMDDIEHLANAITAARKEPANRQSPLPRPRKIS